jgi:hypothetical protein
MYDQYGEDGLKAADQMGEDEAAKHFGNSRGGGMPGGIHFTTSGRPGGGGGGMSQQDAEAFFSTFFGHDDPFGGGFGGRGPGMSFRMGGMPGGGRQGDPMSMMFGGGMPMGGRFGAPGMQGMAQGVPSGGMPMRQQIKRFDAIPNGTIVSFVGLVNQADRNGDRGEVVDYDPSSRRYTIAIEDTDEVLRVKPENLLQHVHVTIQGLSRPELNGKRGTVIRYDEHRNRYNVFIMDTGKTVSVKPENVILSNGTVARIVGTSKTDLNGRYGTINSWHSDSNRYDVQLSADQIVRIKTEALRL